MTNSSRFFRVATASPELRIADPAFNAAKIKEILAAAADRKIQVVCFPELSLSGYTAADLFYQEELLRQTEEAIGDLVRASLDFPDLAFVAGAALSYENNLFNCAVFIQNGLILGAVPKSHLPNSREFYEARWFTSGLQLQAGLHEMKLAGQTVPFGKQLFSFAFEGKEILLGIEICEDLWVPIPPSSEMALDGAAIILNLSASNELVGKSEYRRRLISQQSAALHCVYVYADAGPGESSTDLVFSAHSLIAENGRILKEAELFVEGESSLCYADVDFDLLLSERRHNKAFGTQRNKVSRLPRTHVPRPFSSTKWEQLDREINPRPFVPADPSTLDLRCHDVFNIQAHGLVKRLLHTGSPCAVIGISGGLDSTLALLVIIEAYKKMGKPLSDIIAVTMPGFGTTDHTYQNAIRLMEAYGVTIREVSIREAVLQHFADIGHDPDLHDITYENSQARERTQILMDIANQVNGLVIGTGDLSELALGWCTYNGDQMSMYGVNASVPKTLVKHLIHWRARQAEAEGSKEIATLLDSVYNTPISPELLPPDKEGNIVQHTEDSTGPYELHDFFLYHVMRHGVDPVRLFYMAKHAFSEEKTYDAATILRWLKVFYRRFFNQQFKRSAMPDGPKVGTVSLSPRGDWRMPSDASSAAWLAALDEIHAD